jgi:hypothetical protein
MTHDVGRGGQVISSDSLRFTADAAAAAQTITHFASGPGLPDLVRNKCMQRDSIQI